MCLPNYNQLYLGINVPTLFLSLRNVFLVYQHENCKVVNRRGISKIICLNRLFYFMSTRIIINSLMLLYLLLLLHILASFQIHNFPLSLSIPTSESDISSFSILLRYSTTSPLKASAVSFIDTFRD